MLAIILNFELAKAQILSDMRVREYLYLDSLLKTSNINYKA